MGSYLSSPKKVKESEDQQNKKYAYGVSSMQGWRDHQEDAHNCILDFDEETALFGVYDGHGGAEVAIYTSEKLPEFIKSNEEYKSGDYENALISAFLTFDDTLSSQPAFARLNEIIKSERENKTDDRDHSKADKAKVNGSGDAEAVSSVNGEPAQSDSKAMLKEQSEEVSESSTNGVSESLVNGLTSVNGNITEEVAPSTKRVIESGCTAVVALIKDNNLYVANAGDCRCVICKAGKAVDMSEDHKPENDSERSRIRKAGGKVTSDGRVNGVLNLSRAIGDHEFKRNTKLSNKEQMITALPDVRVCKLEPDIEFIVLACDGIWNSMTSQEVVDFVKPKIQSNQKLSTICEELFDACLAPRVDYCEGIGCDNMTCIIVKIRQVSDNVEAAEEADSKQTSASENIEVDSKKTVDSENVKAVPETGEADSKQENVSEKSEVDSISADQLELADSSQTEKDNKNNEAFPSQTSEAEPVSEIEEKNDSSTRLKRCADSTEEGECQAKRKD